MASEMEFTGITPELAAVASLAALEIDCVIRSLSDSRTAIDELLQGFSQAHTQRNSAESQLVSFPGTVRVLNSAVIASKPALTMNSIQEVLGESSTIFELLRGDIESLGKVEQELLRAFCSSLSIAMSDYLAEERIMEQEHYSYSYA